MLCRRGLPRWGAALGALPVLLDAYQLQLEQEILPDILFAFLVVGAVTLYLWWPDTRRPLWASATAAAALGASAVCWPVGLPLLVLLVLVMIVRRAGWRPVTAAIAAGAVPLVLYLGWYHQEHGRFAFNNASGVFLWSRTMTFADCHVIRLPADERPLCPDKPVAQRQAASLWIWQRHTPLAHMPGKFSVRTNTLAGDFARRAILAQPLGYARAVFDGFAMTFTWNRPPHPNQLMSERYNFALATHDWDHGNRAVAVVRVQRHYTGGHLADTRAVEPISGYPGRLPALHVPARHHGRAAAAHRPGRARALAGHRGRVYPPGFGRWPAGSAQPRVGRPRAVPVADRRWPCCWCRS